MLLTTESQAPMVRRDQLAFVVFGTWMVTGLFVDGWAHNHQKPETFFTPWHAVLYSGFAAAVLWGVIDGRRRPWAPPAGQRLTNIGAVLFGVGAAADMVWHLVFGIEVKLAALLSPTHLLLMTGGILAASGPLRAAWATDDDPAPSLRAFFPTLVSLGLVVAVASFFAQYLSAFRLLLLAPSGQPAAAYVQIFQIVGIASVLATNLLLLVPVALVLRRWRPPAGTFTLLFGGVALLMTALDGFHHLPLVLAAAAGGLAADRFAPLLSPAAVLAVTSLVLWGTFFAVYAAVWGLAWEPELWGGALVLCVLSAIGLGAFTQLTSARPAEPAGSSGAPRSFAPVGR